MQGIATGIIMAILLIVILEISRFFRRISNLLREIDHLKNKVSHIEEFLNNKK